MMAAGIVSRATSVCGCRRALRMFWRSGRIPDGLRDDDASFVGACLNQVRRWRSTSPVPSRASPSDGRWDRFFSRVMELGVSRSWIRDVAHHVYFLAHLIT